MKVNTDKELESFLPPTDSDEELLASLKADGCRDRLIPVTWPGLATPVIGDGHRRHRLCRKHRIPYSWGRLQRFPDKDAAKRWMIDNQLARRNLTDEQRAYFRGKDYLLAKKPHGDITRTEGNGSASAHFEHLQETPEKTAEIVAEKHGVGQATIRRDAEFAAAVDKIGEAKPALREKILAGKSDLTKAEVIRKAKPKKKPTQAQQIAKFAGISEDEARDYLAGDAVGSHPYQEQLAWVRAFAVKMSRWTNDLPADSKAREYMVYCGICRPRDFILNGKKYGWQFIFFRGLYRVLNLAGKRGRLDKRAVLKAFQDAITGED